MKELRAAGQHVHVYVPTYITDPHANSDAHVEVLSNRAGRSHAPTMPLLCFVFVACAQLSMAADPEASIALPFTPRPAMLTGELVGDVGFDPLNFSEEVRSAEIICVTDGVHVVYIVCTCVRTWYVHTRCSSGKLRHHAVASSLSNAGALICTWYSGRSTLRAV